MDDKTVCETHDNAQQELTEEELAKVKGAATKAVEGLRIRSLGALAYDIAPGVGY